MTVSNEIALFRLKVADEVPVFPLAVFITRVRDIYASHLFLNKVEYEGIVPPSDYLPEEDEDLYFNRAEIGTPNLVEFVGLSEPLVNTFQWVVMLMTGLKAVDFVIGRSMTHIKTFYEISELRKKRRLDAEVARAQVQKQTDTRPLRAPDPEMMLDRRTQKLSSKLPVSEVTSKLSYYAYANQSMVDYALSKRIVYAPEIIVVESSENKARH